MKKILFFYVFLILIGCLNGENEKTAITNSLRNVLKDKHFEKYDYYIIIPNVGCTGCITKAETFVIQNIDSLNALFIFTHIPSKKLLKLRITEQVFNHENVIIDDNNDFDFIGENEIYPLIVHMKNKYKIDFYEFQSPKNPEAFTKLKNRMTEGLK